MIDEKVVSPDWTTVCRNAVNEEIVEKLGPNNHLIIFGRYPRVGSVKTRLIPALGPAGAAALQKRLTEKTMAAAGKLSAGTGVRLVFCHDGGDQTKITGWLGVRDIDCAPQAPGGLGHRMMVAMHTAFGRGAKQVVLVGTDVPGLSTTLLVQAFERLKRHDLVLGPSTDGGYWLVGMSRPENIFENIVWSTPTVLEKTLELARRKGMAHCLLDPLTDLDDPDDLAREGGQKRPAEPYLSVIIPTLNEAPRIAQSIATAATADTEIIVADGGSTDRTVEIAQSLGAHIVVGNQARAGQQNLGASAARGEVLLFLHADTRLPRNYVASVFDILMDCRTVLGAFRFQAEINSAAMRWITYWNNLRAGWLKLPYGDQGMFMRKRDFDAVGGFPDVPIAEDLFLARRMARKGRIVLAPTTAVTSARRWQHLGPLQTTMRNALIAAGCLAGVAPDRLAALYRLPLKKNNHEKNKTRV